MIIFNTILITTTFLAYYAERELLLKAYDRSGILRPYKRRRPNHYAFFLILAILIFFVGLRTSYNDTYAYRFAFERLAIGMDAFQGINWVLADNPGFYISNVLIKTFISTNPQVMLFLYALLSIIPIFLFYRRWSEKFWLTVFLFVAGGMLLFSMAAVKQVLAIAIGLCGITCYLKNRRIGFVTCVLIGSTIHAYLPLYLAAFFLSDRLWSRKILMIIFATLLSGVFIDQFFQVAYRTTDLLGANYSKYNVLSGQGVNVFRFAVYSVTPVLTWIYRKRINASRDKALILFSNFTLIGWCFMFFALFGAANMFGRMAAYFDPFMHLALSAIVIQCIPRNKRRLTLAGCLAGFYIFFMFELYTRSFAYHWVFSS